MYGELRINPALEIIFAPSGYDFVKFIEEEDEDDYAFSGLRKRFKRTNGKVLRIGRTASTGNANVAGRIRW
jgi:hypothetical protein